MYIMKASADVMRALCAVPAAEIREYAREKAAEIVTRTRDGDVRRESTPEEAWTLARLISGAISAGRRSDGTHDAIRAGAVCAEYQVSAFFPCGDDPDAPHINTYLSTFLPIVDWFAERGAYSY